MKAQRLVLAAILAVAATTANATPEEFYNNTTSGTLDTPRGKESRADIVRNYSDVRDFTGRPYGNAKMWANHPHAARYPLWYEESVRHRGFESDLYDNESRDVRGLERPTMSPKDPRFDSEWRELNR